MVFGCEEGASTSRTPHSPPPSPARLLQVRGPPLSSPRRSAPCYSTTWMTTWKGTGPKAVRALLPLRLFLPLWPSHPFRALTLPHRFRDEEATSSWMRMVCSRSEEV